MNVLGLIALGVVIGAVGMLLVYRNNERRMRELSESIAAKYNELCERLKQEAD